MAERIRILSENLANRIAAGEVIERPASVVKELAENALDAEAHTITVTVQGAGRRLIRVSDDGFGMNRDDALLAFERHATSKIRSVEDLGCIATLGFRGEALPSIASVSRLTLMTCTQLGDTGTRLELDGGVIRQVREWTGPVGTSIEVRQLFFNTPARLKFLKSRNTELGHMVNVISQLALAHPGIRVRFTHEQQNPPGSPPPRPRWIGWPRFGERKSAGSLSYRRSRGIGAAVRLRVSPDVESCQPRHSTCSSTGARYAIACSCMPSPKRIAIPSPKSVIRWCLCLTLPPQDIDVNVHPHKTEVRFVQPDLVHAVVREAIQRGLSRTTDSVSSAAVTEFAATSHQATRLCP